MGQSRNCCFVVIACGLALFARHGVAQEGPTGCGDPNAGDCFVANGTPFCDDQTCCDLVCAADPFCCDTEWDQLCADAAIADCVIKAVGACCLIDATCTEGTADECTAQGGTYQGDDTACVDTTCPAPKCLADLNGDGEVGVLDLLPLLGAWGDCLFCGSAVAGDCLTPNGTPFCNIESCCVTVCQQDAFCCDVEWDQICVDLALQFCVAGTQSTGNPDCLGDLNNDDEVGVLDLLVLLGAWGPCPGACGGAGTGDCFVANGSPYCDDAGCCDTVCAIDPFCCDSEWDQLCVDQAVVECVDLLQGACCFDDGTCTDGFPEDCVAAGGDYRGDGTSCADSPNPCRGACCDLFFDDFCGENYWPELCAEDNGTFLGFGTDCSPCLGACCGEFGQCLGIMTPGECESMNGCYEGDGSTCDDCVSVNGACCLPDGTCVITDPWVCGPDNGGDFLGTGTNCHDADCPDVGACCFDFDPCMLVIESQCDKFGGTFLGEGTACDAETCSGACCLPDGSCIQTTDENLCFKAGGDYQGNITSCDDVQCVPFTGACCLPDHACEELTSTMCNAMGGVYHGDFSICEVAFCGACCIPGKQKDDCFGNENFTPSACQAIGGFFLGECTYCQGFCDFVNWGSCCLPDGSCVETFDFECKFMNGEFNPALSCDCAECIPAPTGACCDSFFFSCSIVNEFECQMQEGTYMGDGTTCPPGTGACCIDGSFCVDGASDECCTISGGVYLGDGSECAPGEQCP